MAAPTMTGVNSLTGCLQAKADVYAVTIADMLDVIARDFRHTTGRMA